MLDILTCMLHDVSSTYIRDSFGLPGDVYDVAWATFFGFWLALRYGPGLLVKRDLEAYIDYIDCVTDILLHFDSKGL